MSSESLKIEIASQFGAPAVVIDFNVVKRNIAHLRNLLSRLLISQRISPEPLGQK